MACVHLIMLHYLALDFLNAQWISSTSTLPVEIWRHAVGHYQDTIHIIGGTPNENAYMEYNITNKTFSHYTQLFFPIELQGYCQWWYQMNDTLFMTVNGAIQTFNLANKVFTPELSTVPTNSAGIYACLAGDSNRSLLYYVGGWRYETLQILDLNNASWSIGPNMTSVRNHHSCIISPNKQLYAIGGYHYQTGRLQTIEFISTIDINSNVWSYTAKSLSQAISGTRCVLLEHDIYVIGGLTNGAEINTVHIIDTLTNDVRVAPDTLAFPVSHTAPIMVNQVIYAFGGVAATGDRDQWQYSAFPTSHPTEDPTTNPTNNPIMEPTISPTFNPSMIPRSAAESSTDSRTRTPSTAPFVEMMEDSGTFSKKVVGDFSLLHVTIVSAVILLCCCIIAAIGCRVNKRQRSTSGITQMTPIGHDKNSEMNLAAVINSAGEGRKVHGIEKDDRNMYSDSNADVEIELEKMESKAAEEMYGCDIETKATPGNQTDAGAAQTDGHGADKMRSETAEEMFNKSELHTTQALDLNNYMEWNHHDIIIWIMSLDNGIFSHYQDILSNALKLENVTGDDLKDVDYRDIVGWGLD